MPPASPGEGGVQKIRWFLWLYALLFFCLSAAFARFTPPFLPYDEIGHLTYVDHLRLGRGLPIMQGAHQHLGLKNNPGWEFHEAHQPPVYYALLAPAGALARRADPHLPDGAGLLALRLFALALFGGLFAAGAWRLLAQQLPPALAVQAWGAALLSHTLMASFATINNDAGVVAFGVWFLVFLGRETLAGPPAAASRPAPPARDWRNWLWVCLFAGLALGSKAFFVFLLPPLLLSELARLGEHGLKKTAGRLGLLGLAMVACGGWFFVRNQLLYHHPFATPLVKTFITASGMDPASPAHLLRFAKDFFNQFWNVGPFVRGARGMGAPWWYLAPAGALTLLLVGGWWRALRAPGWWRNPLACAGVLGPVFGLLLIFLNSLDIYAPSGRYLLVAMPALWCCLGRLPPKFHKPLAAGLGLFNGVSALAFVWLLWRFLWPVRNAPGLYFGEWHFGGLWP